MICGGTASLDSNHREASIPKPVSLLPLGPERASRLLDEHRRQRQMLGALHDQAVADPKLPSLAEVVRDDIIVVDQSCG